MGSGASSVFSLYALWVLWLRGLWTRTIQACIVVLLLTLCYGPGYCLVNPGRLRGSGLPRPTQPPTHIRQNFLTGKTDCIKEARKLRPNLGTQTFLWSLAHSAPCVTFRLVVVSLRGPGQSPVLPFACCIGSLSFVGRCSLCPCWCCFFLCGAHKLVYRGCAGCSRCRLCVSGAQ